MLGESVDASALTVRAVTKRAGVSPMALYLHFDDREALLSAVRARAFKAFRAGVAIHDRDPDAGPAERFRRSCRAYVGFALDHPAEYRSIFQVQGASVPRPELQVADSAFGDLVARVRACIEAGEAPDADAWNVSCATWAALHGIVTLRSTLPGFPWPAVETMLEQIATGIVGLAPAGG